VEVRTLAPSVQQYPITVGRGRRSAAGFGKKRLWLETPTTSDVKYCPTG